ncbi:beta-ketoacyl synthase chain length factor [Andreprevotia chitinilytica]|uniref:beta-ketoacyl synthase chain length factor n=1 Tax=Andreprevotia chitinilytica TaxID=396808 RepID=UPI00068A9121|nr:beta-ketoacyl synthase chain length factor [Andreprevotia chitinilytica]
MTSSTAHCFRLKNWAAWAPGLPDAESWLAWARGERQIGVDGEPAVAAMPPMLRRRAQRFGRIALESLYALPDDTSPIVFASRHGEVPRSVELLQSLASSGEVSPQSFSMAVHNATAGLFTIASKQVVNVTAIAAGRDSALAGIVEALGLLADGANSVRLILCDAPLPEIYADFAAANSSADAAPYSCVLALMRGDDFSLQTQAGVHLDNNEPGLALLRFMLGTATTQALSDGWQLVRNESTPFIHPAVYAGN